jgi:hypothetical protein
LNVIKNVKIQLRDLVIVDCIVEVSDAPPWKLVLSGLPNTLEGSGKDCFAALTSVRESLEKMGARLLCQGCRPDVYPSGMSRDMGGGRKAYINKLGAPALRTDIIDIFDYAEPEAVGTVAEQRAFHEKWVESLRRHL